MHQQERHMPEFREFYEIYDQIGNIPRPGVVNPQPTHKAVITGPMTYKGQDAIKYELEVVKAGIAEAWRAGRGLFLPGPGARLARPLPLQRVLPDRRGIRLCHGGDVQGRV